MLAADAGAAVSAAPVTDSVQVAPAVPTTDSLATDSLATDAIPAHARALQPSATLVIIDPNVAGDFDAVGFDISAAIPAGAELVVLDHSADAVSQITAILADRSELDSMHLISHGRAGQLQLGNDRVDAGTLADRAAELVRWKASFAAGADLLIYGCDVGAGDEGRVFLDRIAKATGLDVAASVDRTGAADRQADWDLEHTVGPVTHAGDLDRSALSHFPGALSIQVYAAGEIGEEEMQVQVGDQIVGTWTMTGTDAGDRLFGEFNVHIDNVSIDDIRIHFTNDLYRPEIDFDRNLRIDRIVVDGVTYQTEDPAVFSTGSWRPEDGVTPGFRQTEYLHTNGYFQFASTGNESGSVITIDAEGNMGQERMELLIDGQVVQTFENVSTTPSSYSYQANQLVTADRIEIAFTNDFYDPGNDIDRNLTVDRVRVDGQIFETEAPSTYTTGFYVAGQGIVSGFYQNETLYGNGRFQFLADNPPPPPVDPPVDPPDNGESGSFVLVDDFAAVFESDGSVTMTIARVGGSDGVASVQYATESETATAGSDFIPESGSLVFADGETSKSVTIAVLQDGLVEGTESFSFRLTGSENASLLAPRTATINLLDIDQGLPAYASFDSAANLQLNRDARISNGKLQLTSAVPQQRGSAYFTTPISVDADTSFQATFAARFDGGQGSAGGEGLAFIIQNSPGGTAGQDIGNYPGGLAYNAQQNSIGIELDTFRNVYEQYSGEITFTVNGVMVNPHRTIQSPYDLNDGRTYYTWVDYNGQSDSLSVYISDVNEKPQFALMKTTLQLNGIVGNQAYVGFAAATGSAYNNTYIQSWSVTLDTPAADPPTIPIGQIIRQDIVTGLNQPLNVEWSPDGRNMYVGEKAGIVRVSRDGGPLTTMIDITAITNNVQDRGLVDFEVHPDFANNPYIYLNYTVDPPEVYNHVGNPLAGPDGSGNRAGRLIRMTLDASTNYTTVVPGSTVTLLGANSTWNNFNAFVDSTLNFNQPPAGLNPDGTYLQDFINSDSRSHTVGGLAFGTDGALYVGIGDGASFNQTDPRALRVQDPNSLSGKILRIDPITGQGFSDNPFFDGDLNSNRSKVYHLGLRNPWRLSVDPVNGRLYIGETGLVSFEEINIGPPGTNFGWPYYEGGQGVNLRTPSYQGLPQAQAFYNSGQPASPAFIAQPHTNGTDVIVLGSVGWDLNYGPQYNNDVFYADFASGVVRHGSVGAAGNLTSIGVFATGANFAVDIQQGPDGFLYYVDIVSGSVGRFLLI
ncbi:Quinoprotein glucose dehydrogenase B precursor [Stieleria maiorica]|uniref:Quinoprotein glucose dehydrogenase B n=1 Tax=Stieleria maiorica TaxID=2795974 RepID=A0A5B9MPJ3_9BACT|nr:DUF4347 domain-containing protein [Stieleria maiorica]QEG02814.1 Quinoprotein glucose dehydrogenase B precursor [Stieleria maiorica]